MKTKKINKYIIAPLLVLCLALPYLLYLIIDSYSPAAAFPEVESAALNMQENFTFTSNKKLFETSLGAVVVEPQLADTDLVAYSVHNHLSDSDTKITVSESLEEENCSKETFYQNGVLIGTVGYEDSYLTEVEFNFMSSYYDYDDNLFTDIYQNNDHYEYFYNNDILQNINLNDDLFASYSYDTNQKVVSETYDQLSRRYEYTNSNMFEYIYDAETEQKYLQQNTDLLTYNPYTNIQSEYQQIDGVVYELVTSATFEGKTIEFEYDYVYNNMPYITKATTNDDVITYEYLNNLLIHETRNNADIIYLYSSTDCLIGMIYGAMVDGQYVETLLQVLTDGFNNIIAVSYPVLSGTGDDATLTSEYALKTYYNSFGNKIALERIEDFKFSLGFRSLLQFDDFNLNYENGNLYSSLTGVALTETTNLLPLRQTNTQVHQKTQLLLNTFIQYLMIENVQQHLYYNIGLSTTTEGILVQNGQMVLDIDVYTTPGSVDSNNLLGNQAQMYNIYRKDDTARKQQLTAIYNNLTETDSFVYFMDLQQAQSGEDTIAVQFVYNNSLYTAKTIADGLVEYTVQSSYFQGDYLKDINIINYNTNKYVQYYYSTLDESQYIQDFNLAYDLEDIDDFNEYLKSLNLVNSSYAELIREQDYGDNTEFVRNLVLNTFSQQVPDYDPDTEYLSITSTGELVVLPIPDDVGVEHIVDYTKVWNYVGIIVSSVLAIGTGIVLAIPTGCTSLGASVAIVCGIIATAAGTVALVGGIVLLQDELTEGGNFIVQDWFGGNAQALVNICNIALTVSAVASMAGGIAKAFSLCFAAGTPVLTKNGTKAIEDIQVGDEVLTYNEQTGLNEYQKVTRTFENKTNELITVHYNDEEITTTPEHPFYVQGQWVSAKNLQVGDQLTLQSGVAVSITQIEKVDSNEVIVYNFEVENNHNYYVNDGVLVHNKCIVTESKNFIESNKLLDYTDDALMNSDEFKTAMQQTLKMVDDGKIKTYWGFKRNLYKNLGAQLQYADDVNPLGISNLKALLKGKAPIINGEKINLHHIFGIANNQFAVVPMKESMHQAFHMTYGYHWVTPKSPWPYVLINW